MSVFRCRLCQQHVQWMTTKFAKRMLFDATPTAVTLDPEQTGWIPGPWKLGHSTRVVMAPIGHYGRDKRDRVRHVVMLHSCPNLRRETA